jgi:hypothetical protein
MAVHFDERTDHSVRPIPKSPELPLSLCRPQVIGQAQRDSCSLFFLRNEGISQGCVGKNETKCFGTAVCVLRHPLIWIAQGGRENGRIWGGQA